MSTTLWVSIILGVIAALSGGGGVVAWLRHKNETQKNYVDASLRAFEKLLGAETSRRQELEGKVDTLTERVAVAEEKGRQDTRYIEILIAHINDDLPPPPPPRPAPH